MATNFKGFNIGEQQVAIIDAICRQIVNEGLSGLLPVGGTTGQALAKASNANGDVSWQTIAGGGGGTNLAGISDMSANARTFNAAANFSSMRVALGVQIDVDVAAYGHVHSNVVSSGAAGFMTGADKAKLDGIEAGATADLTGAEIVALINGNLGGTTWQGGGGAGSVVSDTIWDAAGDLAVGTGANTAARLAMGTALQVLRVNAGATALEWAASVGVTDGDKGDIVVSASGASWNFDTNVVTAAAKTVLDDITVVAMVNTLGGANSTGSGGLVRSDSPNIVGIPTYDGAYILTASAMGALAIDTTKGLNTKNIAVDSTFTFSAQPTVNNTFFAAHITNTDSAPHIITFPSSFSLVTQAARTTCPIPAAGQLFIGWRWDGAGYKVFGDSDYFNKFDATAAPGVGDDIADGYGPGSFWYNATGNSLYLCESNAAGAAVWTQITSSSALTDGDKGDITVSGSGATWTVDAAAITLAKMANLAQDQVIGRTTASTGVPETFTVTAAARTVLDDVNTGAMLTTLGASAVGHAHTASDISDFSEAVDDRVGAALVLPTGAYDDAGNAVRLPIVIPIACSDETTALTTGTGKVSFTMPVAMTLTAISASVVTAPTGANLIVDVNEAGNTLMTTNKCVIEVSELNTHTAATAPTLTDTTLAKGAVVTVDIDQIGSTVAGAGLKVYLVGFITGY